MILTYTLNDTLLLNQLRQSPSKPLLVATQAAQCKIASTLGVVLGPEMRLARTLEPDPDHTGVGKGRINGLPSSPLDCLAV